MNERNEILAEIKQNTDLLQIHLFGITWDKTSHNYTDYHSNNIQLLFHANFKKNNNITTTSTETKYYYF